MLEVHPFQKLLNRDLLPTLKSALEKDIPKPRIAVVQIVENVDDVGLSEKALVLHAEQMDDLYNLIRLCQNFSDISEYPSQFFGLVPGAVARGYPRYRFAVGPQRVIPFADLLIHLLEPFQKDDFVATLVQLAEQQIDFCEHEFVIVGLDEACKLFFIELRLEVLEG